MEQRYIVEGVSRYRITVFIQHHIGIAVICRQQDLTVLCQDGVYDLRYALIQGFDGFLCSLYDTCMTNHIGVGKIQDDQIVFICFDGFQNFFCYFISAHFRLQVVCGHLRRRNQDAVFVAVRCFHTTVEEEGYMGVFFCFRNAQLGQPLIRDIFSQRIGHGLRREGKGDVGHLGIVLSHADVAEIFDLFFSFKSIEILIHKCPCDFSGTVRAEIEHDHSIAVVNAAVCFINDSWEYEFIVFITAVSLFHCRCTVGSMFPFAARHSVVGFFDTIPAFVTIHGIVAAGYGCDRTETGFFHVIFQLTNVFFGAARRHVSAVQEAVNIKVFDAFFFRHIDESKQVADMAVDATIRKQP